MPVTRPCIVGRMGSTIYYETTMTGRELASSVRPAKETEGWATASIEERMQRKFDIKRIRETIVPYLAQHPDRLFGSLIVLVPAGSIEFEPLDKIIKEPLNAAYRESAKQIGFLTIDKGELIALDGQHRLLAFREVITGGSELGPFAGEVGDDEVCVMFIEFENNQKTRRIFNKVNRHAKPTGRSDNIITSEDDGNAIVTRWLLDTDRNAPLAERHIDGQKVELVNWQSNTLGQNSRHLTTISTVYETVKDILSFKQFAGFDENKNPIAPPEKILEDAYTTAAEWWEAILTLDAFTNALADPGTVQETRYDPSHHHSLLLRPVGQVAFVKGLIRAIDRSDGALTLTEAIKRSNKIDWSSPPTSIWRDTIVRPDRRVSSRSEEVALAADLVAYLIGDEYMDETMRHNLWTAWNKARGKDVEHPIDQIDNDDLLPEDLPAPLDP
ncbi:MAG TPA: DNA sulfur modification protein DndB [Ilumatobacteraceae bacterium]|nr:DNA sulfur modification protein DndB [Ilumatobacteraceae bacterium]